VNKVSATNWPGSRDVVVFLTNENSGIFYLFGGYGYFYDGAGDSFPLILYTIVDIVNTMGGLYDIWRLKSFNSVTTGIFGKDFFANFLNLFKLVNRCQ
jgi:hypothetical protein